MEAISEQDAFFLIALAASEESPLIELKWVFEKWDCSSVDVTKIIEFLIEQKVCLLSNRTVAGFDDYTELESIEISKGWSTSESWDIILFLTEEGERRWQIDDWGITTKRARYLMFSNQDKPHRTQ